MLHLNKFYFNKVLKKIINYQILTIQRLIFNSIQLNKKFLVIDNFELSSHSSTYINFFFKDLLTPFKYLVFLYSKSKAKKSFIIYFDQLIKLKRISFLLFLNYKFYKNNVILFSRFKIAKIGVFSQEVLPSTFDYTLSFPGLYSYFTYYSYHYYIYSLISIANTVKQIKYFSNFLK